MKKIIVFALCLFSLLILPIRGQQTERETMLIRSWKTGNETFNDYRIVKILLEGNDKDFQTTIVSDSGKQYVLSARHNPIKDLKGEHWNIELQEVGFDKKENKEVLGNNLLSTIQFEADDFSPRESFISYFYPNESRIINVNNIPHIVTYTKDGSWNVSSFYLTNIIRKIRVEDFLVTLKAGNYSLNEKDKNNVDSFEIFVEFRKFCN